MLIPIGTDYRMRIRPWVNYAIILANVLIFLLGYRGDSQAGLEKINNWLLHPIMPELHQFFTSVFLHGGWSHLIGNMIFLWVFGNALNDRFGHLGYLAFYLAGGVLAGVGYVILGGRAPVLGASGAISAVTGAYLVLLPRVRVSLMGLLIYVIVPFELSSLYFLLFQFIFNLYMSLGGMTGAAGGGGVAYVAHSAGYVFGIGVAALLLAVKVLPRDPYDLLNLIQNWHRRRSYHRMVAQGYDPFNYAGEIRHGGARRIKAKVLDPVIPGTPEAKSLELRRGISAAIARHDTPTAADKYLHLLAIEPDAVLARDQQLDVSNQLMADNRYSEAADAYEKLLSHYPAHEHRGDIRLMLGLLYGRYLNQYERAMQNLQTATEQLGDTKKLELAQTILAEAREKLGK